MGTTNKLFRRKSLGIYVIIFSMILLILSGIVTPVAGQGSVEIEGSEEQEIEKTLYWDQEAVFEITLKNEEGNKSFYKVQYENITDDWEVRFEDIDEDTDKIQILALTGGSGKTDLDITLHGKVEFTFKLIVKAPAEPVDDD
ncbi:MAG: hypothetical protein KAJ51_17635, partial [Thermoplasmata archaeon]|nr:hypothetical protein [Thermoplasmata archaeon]